MARPRNRKPCQCQRCTEQREAQLPLLALFVLAALLIVFLSGLLPR